MNTTTFSEYHEDTVVEPKRSTAKRHEQGDPHLVVQILSTIAFGAFSIVAVAMAFVAFWVAGMVVAIVIAGIWSGSRTFGGRRKWAAKNADHSIDDVAPSVSSQRATGNASFDAYRGEMLQRLEQESHDFEGFLTRLRDARDATEFDQFMDDRASKSLQDNSDA